MNWNTDRIARLSGLISRDEYRETALNESINRSRLNEMSPEEYYTQDSRDRENQNRGRHTDKAERQESEAQARKAREAEAGAFGATRAEEAAADDIKLAKERGDSVEESRLRQIIRKEVGQVIDEVMAARDAKQLHNAQKSRNVGVAMGFSSDAFRPRTNRPNRASSRGPGGKKGFGGPGFM